MNFNSYLNVYQAGYLEHDPEISASHLGWTVPQLPAVAPRSWLLAGIDHRRTHGGQAQRAVGLRGGGTFVEHGGAVDQSPSGWIFHVSINIYVYDIYIYIHTLYICIYT